MSDPPPSHHTRDISDTRPELASMGRRSPPPSGRRSPRPSSVRDPLLRPFEALDDSRIPDRNGRRTRGSRRARDSALEGLQVAAMQRLIALVQEIDVRAPSLARASVPARRKQHGAGLEEGELAYWLERSRPPPRWVSSTRRLRRLLPTARAEGGRGGRARRRLWLVSSAGRHGHRARCASEPLCATGCLCADRPHREPPGRGRRIVRLARR
jgi:hypothetical protein